MISGMIILQSIIIVTANKLLKNNIAKALAFIATFIFVLPLFEIIQKGELRFNVSKEFIIVEIVLVFLSIVSLIRIIPTKKILSIIPLCVVLMPVSFHFKLFNSTFNSLCLLCFKIFVKS